MDTTDPTFMKLTEGGILIEMQATGGEENLLTFFQHHTGGNIELIHFPALGVDAYVHEEGKFEKGRNEIGTMMWLESYIGLADQYGFLAEDFVAGNVIFINDETDDEGNTQGLNSSQIDRVYKAFEKASQA